jgi:hypothetical protein
MNSGHAQVDYSNSINCLNAVRGDDSPRANVRVVVSDFEITDVIQAHEARHFRGARRCVDGLHLPITDPIARVPIVRVQTLLILPTDLADRVVLGAVLDRITREVDGHRRVVPAHVANPRRGH